MKEEDTFVDIQSQARLENNYITQYFAQAKMYFHCSSDEMHAYLTYLQLWYSLKRQSICTKQFF